MHRLAEAIAALAEAKGARFRYETHVARIEVQGGRPVSLATAAGERIAVDRVVFAGDPQALSRGLLGAASRSVVAEDGIRPRSLSALVRAFAAQAEGPELAHHTVVFGADPAREFEPLLAGRLPEDPTVYICAEDRGTGTPPTAGRTERFETIVNAPPLAGPEPTDEEIDRCLTRASATLTRCGIRFLPEPGADTLTTPRDFDRLFPASDGSLYGRSPHGRWAAFARPRARTALPGLVLAGGGTHPGAGVPMAMLSGRHAAEAIMTGPTFPTPSPPTAMRGGMSTASPTTDGTRSPSSASSARSSRPGTDGPDGATRPTTAASTSPPTDPADAGR
jgi:1-hydroxycarotenoid 3,4-desaturase